MLTSMMLVAWCALPGPVPQPFSVPAAQQRFVELDGVLFARQGAWSVSVDPRGLVAFTGTQRVAFEVVEVRRDGAACATGAQWRSADGVVAKVARACGVSETWATRDDGVEHSLVLDRAPPGRGPLRVKVAAQGAWHHADAQGHVFAGPGGDGALRYGNAFVVRGGAKFPIAVEHVEGALELVVPAALVDAPGAFPLHVDPLVSDEQWLDPASRLTVLDFSNETAPAVAWGPESGGRLLVAWVDDRRLVQTDLFGALLRRDGSVVKASLPLVVGPGNERKPALAWNPVSQHFVLAWEERAGVGWQEFDLSGLPAGAKHPIAGARSPSLAQQPDAAVGLAYATSTNLFVRTLDESIPPFSIGWGNGEVAKTSLAVSATDYALAVEAMSPQSQQSHVWLYGSGPTPLLWDSTMSAANHTDPVVMFGAGSPWVAYTTLSRVVARQANTGVTSAVFQTSSAPRLFLSDAGLTLGWRAPGAITLRALEPQQPDTQVPLLVNDWAVVDADGTPFAAWTVGALRSDVRAGPLLSSMGTPLGQVTWQQHPRVAVRGGAGWAVWQGDSRQVFAAPFTLALDGGSPTVSPPLDVFSASAGSRFENVDVAMSERHALVAVGQTGTNNAVRTALLQGAMVTPRLDTVVMLASPDRLVGPVVAWSGTDYVVAWSDGDDLFIERQTPEGVKRALTPVPVTGLTKVDLACLATGQCFVASTATGNATVFEVDGGVVATAPVTGAVALSDDGAHLCGAWPDDGGFRYACVDEQHQVVDEALVPWFDGAVGDVELSAGRPGVLMWSDGTRLWTVRPGESPTVVGDGFAPAVATELVGNGARGVVVATRFDTDFSQRVFVRGVVWADDAGARVDGGLDAGREDAGLDAGREDAGREDAGLDAGTADAGVTSVDFTTSGCEGCTTGAPVLLWLVLLPLWRRRSPSPPGERVGVRVRDFSE